MRIKTGLTAAILTLSLTTAASAESHMDKALEDAKDAREAHMELYSFNMSLLGGMAKGALPYDADSAGKAADSLAALTMMDQTRYWIEGSDEMSIDDTRAKPEIWENIADFQKKETDLIAAAKAMQGAASQSLGALQGAIGPLGGACGACHKVYRAPKT